MSSYSDYYETNLYPLQDGVLKCVEESSAGFFLTGGTALSRVYCNHRYSDDLDLFLCSDHLFIEKVDKVLASLQKAGYIHSNEKNFIRTADFASIYVQHPGLTETTLKVDFVNDVAPHYGEFVCSNVFSKIDSLRNILSNKLSALFRFEGKDVADIYAICRVYSFYWEEIVDETRQKEAGFEVPLAAEILLGFPEAEFKALKWKTPPRWEDFYAALKQIVFDLTRGKENTLVGLI